MPKKYVAVYSFSIVLTILKFALEIVAELATLRLDVFIQLVNEKIAAINNTMRDKKLFFMISLITIY